MNLNIEIDIFLLVRVIGILFRTENTSLPVDTPYLCNTKIEKVIIETVCKVFNVELEDFAQFLVLKIINKSVMKRKVYIIMLLICSVIIVSCNPAKETSSKTVRNLNLSEEPLQETPTYKSVEIIKLETSPSSLIGNIKRLEMNDSLLFILEFEKLHVFTREGKFVSQIGEKGEGPDEYIVLSSFYIDNTKQQVTIIDNYKNTLINYDFNGKYLSTISVPAKSFESSNYTLLTEDNKLLNYNMMDMRDTKAYSLFDMDKQKVERYFSYQPITVGNYMYPFSWHPMARSGKDIDIIMPLCDTIFTYSAESASFEPKYIVETPRKMAPKDKIRKNTPSYTEDLCELSEQGFFTGFTGIFETDAKVLLEYKDQGVVLGYFLFDKESQAGHYYLSTSSKEDTTLPFFHTIYAYKNTFVGCARPGDLLELENLQDKEIRESIKSLKEDDNPCLILYELE